MTDVRPRGEVTQATDPSPRRARPAGQVAIAITVALLGFLLAIQLRSQQGLADRLAIERESDLGRILTALQTRSDQLLDDILDLRVRLAQANGSTEQRKALIGSARDELSSLQILLGVVPVRGPGIVMTVQDPLGTVGPDVVLDAVQELRDAGAEAIEISGVRVVAATWFGGQAGALRIDGNPVSFPLTIKAIGRAATLAEAMRIPGGTVDALSAREGASVRIQQRDPIAITTVAEAPTFTSARPGPRR